ncbi:MAG TPA: histidine phosphatase family protein [Steroidobacteraceae bacterium]|nr:histidine phosphatase family protein [Steroidobacteraceae bacterium]
MDPLTRLRRRPFMAPLLFPLLAVLMGAAGVYWLGTWAKTTVVVLVRHAEAGESTSGDPELSPAGERRVAALGGLLDDVLTDRRVDYLYAADTRRAQQTAAPVANQFRLPINVLASSDWAGLASRIRREHRGKTVVVVGYATTLPGVINQLSGQALAMRDDEFDAIYVVVMPSPGQTRVLRLRYGVAREARPKSK